MKKSLIIIASICILAGSILIFAGKNMGGNLSINIISTPGNGVRITDGDCTLYTEDLKSFSDFNVKTSFVDVKIVKGDKYSIESFVPEQFKPEISYTNGRLRVEQPEMNMNISLTNVSQCPYYKITIPSDDIMDTHITTSSGDVEIDKINIKGEISQSSGDATINGISSKSLNLNASSGSLKINKVTLENLAVTRSSGNISFEDVKANKMELKSSSGEIELGKTESDAINASATSGDITIKNNTCNTLIAHTSSGEVHLDSVNAPDISIESTSGDVEVNNTSSDNLKINGSSSVTKLNNTKTKKLDSSKTSGNFVAEDLTVDNINISASSSEIDLDIVGIMEDYGYNIHTTSGDINVGKTESENKFIFGEDSDKMFNIQTTSGDVDISFN